jgi:hypothetical protein
MERMDGYNGEHNGETRKMEKMDERGKGRMNVQDEWTWWIDRKNKEDGCSVQDVWTWLIERKDGEDVVQDGWTWWIGKTGEWYIQGVQ